MKWAYGVTTVPERIESHLPQTLASLKAGGFDHPILFLDGITDTSGVVLNTKGIVYRFPKMGCTFNWTLSLSELFIRNPQAERFALFQDDLVACKGLRQYLDGVKYQDGPADPPGVSSPRPQPGYWNLYACPAEQDRAKGREIGFHRSNQNGRGALALVFSREAVLTLLTSRHLIEAPLDSQGFRRVDGAILESMRKAGWQELVHHPSLVKHTGRVSTIDKRKGMTEGVREELGKVGKFPQYHWDQYYNKTDFPGEDFDAVGWISY